MVIPPEAMASKEIGTAAAAAVNLRQANLVFANTTLLLAAVAGTCGRKTSAIRSNDVAELPRILVGASTRAVKGHLGLHVHGEFILMQPLAFGIDRDSVSASGTI